MFISKPMDPQTLPFPDTTDGSSGVLSILATNGFFIPIVTIVISLRLYTRFFMARHLFLDDYLMIGSAVCFLIAAAVNLAGVAHGFGLHGWDLPGASVAERLRASARVLEHNFVSLVLLSPCICAAKLSIVAALLRIFTARLPLSRPLRHVLLATALVVAVCCGAQLAFLVLQCTRVSLSWELIDPAARGSCGNLEEATIWVGVVNGVTDLVICCAPVPVFMRLQLPLRQRLCVCALFLSGLITSLFAIIRVVSSRGLENNYDATYVVVPYLNYSMAEAGLCIITGSIPALRPLLATILPNFVEQYNLDNLMVSAKGNIRRATSRPASRHRRAPSDADSDCNTMSPQQSNTARDPGQGSSCSEIEKAERGETNDSELGSSSASSSSRPAAGDLLRRLRLATADFLQRFYPGGLASGREEVDEELARGRKGRPLSVINELDESSEERERRSRTTALRDSVVEMFKTGQGAAAAAATRPARWPQGTASTDNIVVITDIKVTDNLRAVRPWTFHG